MRIIVTVVITALTAAAPAFDQRAFADLQRANQVALRQYSWKSRTEVLVDGQSRLVRLEQVRFDYDGRLQKTAIGGGSTSGDASRPGPPGKVGEVRKRLVAKKKDGFQDLLADLAALAESYAHLPADRLQAFAARAVPMEGRGGDAGSVRLQGEGVLLDGDRLSVWIDAAALSIRRVEVVTEHDGHQVTLSADYRALADGVTYQARSTLRYPKKQLDVVVESFDFERSASE